MRRVVPASIVLLLIAGCATAPAPTKQPFAALVEPTPPPPTQTPPPFPTQIVELRGTGSEIGTEHGKELAEPIQILFEKYLRPYFQNDTQRMIALTLAQAFEMQLAPAHREEVKALAKQVNLDEREAMLAQCFLDLSAITACSTITLPADASPDGIARFGRNLDFPGRAIADKHTVVMVYHPRDANAFVAVGWPGLIGVLSGMNEHGLTLANMEITRPARLPTAMPYTLLYRTILEKCRTVDEAIKLLEKTPRQTPNNLMLMDAAGNRAVAEITPQVVTVRRGEPGKPLMSTNQHRGQDGASPGRCDRYDTMLHLATAQYGKIDPASIESMLAQVAQGNMTLQSMIFEPSTRAMYLATGANAASRQFYRLDLNPYFNP
jgi:predicted choloylglycine hydrolase